MVYIGGHYVGLHFTLFLLLSCERFQPLVFIHIVNFKLSSSADFLQLVFYFQILHQYEMMATSLAFSGLLAWCLLLARTQSLESRHWPDVVQFENADSPSVIAPPTWLDILSLLRPDIGKYIIVIFVLGVTERYLSLLGL